MSYNSAFYKSESIFSGGGASPGVAFNRSGNVPSNTFLQVGTVISSTTGILSPVSGEIVELTATAQNITTCTFTIHIRTAGPTFTPVATINLTASRSNTTSITAASVNKSDELACQITSGSAQNPVVTAIMSGVF